MRVLFTVWPSRSHFFQMVPLGWALQAAGHDVRVASLPALAPAVAGAGLTPVSVGADVPDLGAMSSRGAARKAWHQQRRWPADWPSRLSTLDAEQRRVVDALSSKALEMAGHMVGPLVDFARAWQPDLVVYDSVSLAGPVAAAAVGAPTVSHLWGLTGVHRCELDESTVDPRPEYLELFARVGAPPRLDADVWLDPVPPSMWLPAPVQRTAVRYVPYNGPGALPDWLLDPPRRPRVCVTWGLTEATVHGPGLPDLVRDAVAALAGLDVEVVLATAAVPPGGVPGVPPQVRTLASFPLHMLLPSCDLVLHQGGGGTTLTAALYGVPQVILSPRPAQLAIGDRVAAVGAGRHHEYHELAAEPGAADVLRAEVAAVLADAGCRAAAGRLRADVLAQPTPADLVPTLAALAGHGGLTTPGSTALAA